MNNDNPFCNSCKENDCEVSHDGTCNMINVYLQRYKLTDMELPLANRTQANLWKAKFFELHRELRKTNKALRKKSRQIKKFKLINKACDFLGTDKEYRSVLLQRSLY